VCAIFVLRDSELVEMVEEPFAAEKDLQRYLAAHPELLSSDAPGDERRRWLLVRREMGVADHEGGGDRWSLDHLFVDQDAEADCHKARLNLAKLLEHRFDIHHSTLQVEHQPERLLHIRSTQQPTE
jgi:hypothetical protein